MGKLLDSGILNTILPLQLFKSCLLQILWLKKINNVSQN